MSRFYETEKRYNELLMAVESKFPGETRHQTALRYIRDRENSGFTVKVATDKDFEEITLRNWPKKSDYLDPGLGKTKES